MQQVNKYFKATLERLIEYEEYKYQKYTLHSILNSWWID